MLTTTSPPLFSFPPHPTLIYRTYFSHSNHHKQHTISSRIRTTAPLLQTSPLYSNFVLSSPSATHDIKWSLYNKLSNACQHWSQVWRVAIRINTSSSRHMLIPCRSCKRISLVGISRHDTSSSLQPLI